MSSVVRNVDHDPEVEMALLVAEKKKLDDEIKREQNRPLPDQTILTALKRQKIPLTRRIYVLGGGKSKPPKLTLVR